MVSKAVVIAGDVPRGERRIVCSVGTWSGDGADYSTMSAHPGTRLFTGDRSDPGLQDRPKEVGGSCWRIRGEGRKCVEAGG